MGYVAPKGGVGGGGGGGGGNKKRRGETTRLRACAELAQWGRPWCYYLLSRPVGNEGAGISAA
jgi:hypothetical protein